MNTVKMCLKDPSRDSVVCIATIYGLKFWGSIASILQDFLHPSSLASKLTHNLQNGKRLSLQEIKRPGRNNEAPSHPPPTLSISGNISLHTLCLQYHVIGSPVPLPKQLRNFLWK